MLDRVDRYAPESASWRLGIGAVLAVPGLAVALFGLYGFQLTVVDPDYVVSLPALAMLLLGGLAAAVGGHLLAGVARQAEAAPPSANPARTPEGTEEAEDPVAALRRRYAEGELTEEELDRKVERLLEVEQRAATEPEPAERLTE